jgi:hypothetical protein
MSDNILLAETSFEDQPFEDLPLGELGIEELESRVQLSSTTAEWEVDVSVGVSW